MVDEASSLTEEKVGKRHEAETRLMSLLKDRKGKLIG